jgi:hypothetical protein
LTQEQQDVLRKLTEDENAEQKLIDLKEDLEK